MTPGIYTLCSLPITTALSGSRQTAILNLGGVRAVRLRARFQYGSGGTSLIARVRTTFDGGTTMDDAARFDFAQATAVLGAVIGGDYAAPVSTYTALAAAGVGLPWQLGDQLEVMIDSVGVYVNTTLDIRAHVIE